MPKRPTPKQTTNESPVPIAANPSVSDATILSEVQELLLGFGADHRQNLDRIFAFAMEKMNGQFAVFRYFDFVRQAYESRPEGLSPKGFSPSGKLSGCVCYEAFVIEKRPRMLIRNLSETAYWDSDPDIKRHGLKAYLGCPVVVSGRMVGAFSLFDTQPDQFSAQHLDLMMLLAGVIAFVEQHQQAEKDLSDKLRREKILSQISSRAITNLETRRFLANSLEMLGSFMGADGVSLFRQRTTDSVFKICAHWPVADHSDSDLPQNFNALFALPKFGGFVRKGHVYQCVDAKSVSDPQLAKVLSACKVNALLVVPFFDGKTLLGCCAFYWVKDRPQWCDEDIATVTEVINTMGLRLGDHSVALRLDKSEALVHQLFQLSPAAIYRIDLINQRIVAVNDYFCQASGYTREELLSLDPLKFLTPESLNRYLGRLEDIAAGRPVSEIVDFEVITKAGDVEWGRFHIQHMYEGDQIVGANVVAHIVTEQRKAREALNDYRKNLESMVSARVTELAKTNQALRDEIVQRVQATENLQASSERLKEMNTAMRVLLDKRMEDHQRTEELIRINLKELIDPYLTRLENGDLRGSQKQLVELIRVNLDEVVTSSMPELASKYFMFSPNELQVVNLIRKGKTTKEMARLLNLSTRTVESYRDSIRKKLGLKNKKVNLRTYLSSI